MIKAGRTVNVGDHIPFVICIEPIGSVAASTPGATPSVLAPLGTGDGFAPPAAAVAADASPAGTPGLAPPPVRSALGGSPAGVTAPSPATSAAASPREEVATTTPDKALAGGGGGIGGGSSGPVSFASRAYHPEEVRKSGGRLHLDIEWYLTNQILPPVARECLAGGGLLEEAGFRASCRSLFRRPLRAHRRHVSGPPCPVPRTRRITVCWHRGPGGGRRRRPRRWLRAPLHDAGRGALPRL